MGAIIMVIFLMPLLYQCYKRIGNYIIVVGFLLPYVFNLNIITQRFSLLVAIAICCSRENWIEKISKVKFNISAGFGKFVKVLCYMISILVLIGLKQSQNIGTNLRYSVEAITTFLIVVFLFEVLSFIKIFSATFRFLGKHSMNIYFVHAFFSTWIGMFKDFIYSFRNALSILFVLLGISLLYSFCLEQIKKGIVHAVKMQRKTNKGNKMKFQDVIFFNESSLKSYIDEKD